jgi:quercetin dioxygenase-like cupin family protein
MISREISPLLYAAAIPAAIIKPWIIKPWIVGRINIFVALMWLIPGRRIERVRVTTDKTGAIDGTVISVVATLHTMRWEMLEKSSSDGYSQVLDGIRQKTLVHGDKTLMVEFRLRQNAALPLHSHPHEQTGYLVAGHIRLTIGEVVHDVRPGDSWCISGGTLHGAESVAESVAVEVFSPVRQDYL